MYISRLVWRTVTGWSCGSWGCRLLQAPADGTTGLFSSPGGSVRISRSTSADSQRFLHSTIFNSPQQNCKKLQSPIRLWRLPCRGWILTSFWHNLIISSQKSTQTSLSDQLYSEILTWTWWSIKCASDTFHPHSVRSLTNIWASWFPRCGPPTIVTPWEMSGMRYSLTRS